MSIRRIVGMDNGLDDFTLEVCPRSITLPKHCKFFVLYLEKGMQIIGKFQSSDGAELKDPFYRFRYPQPAIFRINNLAHSNYSWALYSINPLTNEENLQDSAAFNIERTVKLYQVQLLQKEREIQTSMKEKNVTKGMVLDLWRRVKREMKSCRSIQKCVFTGQDYQIEFQVEIKNTLDFELEKMEEEEQVNLLRRVKSEELRASRSDKSRSITHPPNVIELESAPYRSNLNFKEEELNTKQTIEPEVSNIPIQQGHAGSPDPDEDNFNATVKIVNPRGEQVDDQEDAAFAAGTGPLRKTYTDDSSQYNYPTPVKKFSLLSDIIEMSHEGSSSYGHPDRSSSNGNRLPRKDTALDLVVQTKGDSSPEPLNKFKTLPYESHHHRLEVRDQFRRAQTAEKTMSEIENSQIQEESSYISGHGQALQEKQDGVQMILRRISVKWVIIAVFLLIFGVALLVWSDTPTRKKAKRKSKMH